MTRSIIGSKARGAKPKTHDALDSAPVGAPPPVTKPHGAVHHGGIVKVDRKPERVARELNGELKQPEK